MFSSFIQVSETAKVYVDGGTYSSPQHGAFYTLGNVVVKNAVLGYKTDFDINWNIEDAYFNAGFYASGTPTTSTKIYIDNCTIDNHGAPITFTKSQSASSINLYVSNTNILNQNRIIYIHNPEYHIHLGTGNNFDTKIVDKQGFPLNDGTRPDVSGSIHTTDESYASKTLKDI